MNIKKAIITAAGAGTRMRPWTKAISKEMLPIINRPFIELIVDELVTAGINDIIIVVKKDDLIFKNYFADFKKARITFCEQIYPYGTAGAIFSAKDLIGDNDFLVFWGDEIIHSQPNRATLLLQAFATLQQTIFGAIEVTDHGYFNKLAFVKGQKQSVGFQVNSIVEKPTEEFSTLATVGGGILTKAIWPIFDRMAKEDLNGQEFHLTNAVKKLIDNGGFYVLPITGEYLSIGTPEDYFKTLLYFASYDQNLKPLLLTS